MARQVRGWDALRAWRFIRASRAYRGAWAKRLPMPGLPERAPFPVRLQTAADLAATIQGHRIRFAKVDPAASTSAIRDQLLRFVTP